MQISIIIPVYNVEAYIERCINSVIHQTFTDYEVILVDDASPDNALQIVEKLLIANNITFQSIKHKINQGLSEARNSGIKVAKGKYIMFIDSDDELSHGKVLSQFYDAIVRENVDFVVANRYAVLSDGTRKRGIIKGIETDRLLQNDEILPSLIYREMPVAAWSKLIDKHFLLSNHLFFQKGLLCEDELWTFQMCIAAQKCYCLSDYSYNYYKDNPHSITNNHRRYESKILILKSQLNLIKEKELLNSNNATMFIFHFNRLSAEVLQSRLFNNRQQWIACYQQINKIYQQSGLYQYKRLFYLPAHIAYYIKWIKKASLFIGKRLYLKLLKTIGKHDTKH